MQQAFIGIDVGTSSARGRSPRSAAYPASTPADAPGRPARRPVLLSDGDGRRAARPDRRRPPHTGPRDPTAGEQQQPDRRRQRALVEVVELAADRHAVRQPRHFHARVGDEIGDVVRGGLTVDGCVQGQDNFSH